MIALWTEPLASFQGRHVQLAPCRMDPKPVQKPHIPIVVGGHAPRSLRRAAELGCGWYGFGLTPQLTAGILKNLDRALAAAGRSRDGFEIVITPQQATPETIAAFSDLGVHRLVVQLGSQKADAVERRLPELERLVKAASS
jgi:alkanesulfonate monooxygenase SsuD/methylene tetrahydromethanopterin reductase-like flavin-dependent oxidoreductase (luciferase family)